MPENVVVLCILDGFGCSKELRGNAIAAADMPNWHAIEANNPHTKIRAAEESVGLPKGQQGNSEVGHLNLGAGRVVMQTVTRIDDAIKRGVFAQNPALQQCFAHVKRTGGTLHLLGLVSPGGVHSSMTHLDALMDAAKVANVKVKIAAFLDGRDTPPRSAGQYLADVEKKCRENGNAAISMICGRYYAMDRDKRWERTEKAYDALVRGKGLPAESAAAGLEAAYARGEDDEFVLPTIIADGGSAGTARPIIVDGDACLFFNFRPDRARQLTRAFSDPDFKEFPVEHFSDFIFAIMTLYDATFTNPVMFGKTLEKRTLGEVVADAGLKQLRLAETEKYAHVTYFFSGGREEPFPGEERVLIPSARDVGTYDHKPEMRAREITEAALAALKAGKFALIVMNYANPDMVGHTGKWGPIVESLHVVDECLGKLDDAVRAAGGILIVTADHGNAEEKIDLATGTELTAHTINPVPFVIVGAEGVTKLRSGGALCDVAPTICALMHLQQPPEMTCHSLLG
ncbi:MAG TPA: 2,3-bisphosphoglycerate-independent phosphoglycerate mutase [Candidatus Eremiobacteraceae bacterium]|nr:2,3-bisphosphoglycerate-independent phosphoglycerate mutase [Candidatus Eremiobacteraceae bacterium]